MEFYAPGIPAGRQQTPIQAAHYESATSHRLNERHWAIGPQTADPTPEQRAELRNRTRYEVANNSVLEGMIETYARDMVGSGPHPAFFEFGSQAKTLKAGWELWTIAHGIPRLIKAIARALLIDGEAFLLSIDEAPFYRVIEPERIYFDGVVSDRREIIEGIEYVDGVPVRYYVDGKIPFDADVMSHIYQQKYPNQRRGVPRPSPSLDMFAYIRRTNIAAITAYETAAKIAGVLQTNHGVPDVQAKPFESIDLVSGAFLTLPMGYTVGQVKAEHPVSSHREIIAMFTGEAARCFPMPLNKALGTSQDSNFASGSLDNIDYERAIRHDQQALEVGPVQRCIDLFLLEQGVEPQPVFVGWDAIPHLNPEKQLSEIEGRIALRLTSRTREALKRGEVWEEIEAELQAEEAKMKPQEPGGDLEGSTNEKDDEQPPANESDDSGTGATDDPSSGRKPDDSGE